MPSDDRQKTIFFAKNIVSPSPAFYRPDTKTWQEICCYQGFMKSPVKNLLIPLAVLVILLVAHSANAQNRRVLFGVRAGGTVSGIISKQPLGDWIDHKQTGHWGYTAGVLVEIRATKMFSVQPELLITLKGSSAVGRASIMDDAGVTAVARERQRQSLTYLELPVKMILKIPVGRYFLNIAAGPYAAYGLVGEMTSNFERDGRSIDRRMTALSLERNLFKGRNAPYSRWDAGFVASVGWEFGFGLFFDAGYSYGITTIASDRKFSDHNGSGSLSMGWKF
jgi:hypothetical protein